MLDVQAVARFEFKLNPSARQDSMDPETSPEDRLEAALDRIARHIEEPDPVATEVAARLDGIIDKLRSALDQ